MTRTRTALAVLVLTLAAGLSACGGGGPGDATEQEFCDAQGSLFSGLGDSDAMPSEEELAGAFQDWGEELESVGTPEGMPEDARAGFEAMVEQVKGVDARDFSGEDLGGELDQLAEDSSEEARALTEYVSKTCSGLMGDLAELDVPEVPELPSPGE